MRVCLQAFWHTSAHVTCGAALLTSSLSFLIHAFMRTRGSLSNRRRRCSMQWTTCGQQQQQKSGRGRAAAVWRLLLCLPSAAYSVELLLYREGSNQFGHPSWAAVFEAACWQAAIPSRAQQGGCCVCWIDVRMPAQTANICICRHFCNRTPKGLRPETTNPSTTSSSQPNTLSEDHQEPNAQQAWAGCARKLKNAGVQASKNSFPGS